MIIGAPLGHFVGDTLSRSSAIDRAISSPNTEYTWIVGNEVFQDMSQCFKDNGNISFSGSPSTFNNDDLNPAALWFYPSDMIEELRNPSANVEVDRAFLLEPTIRTGLMAEPLFRKQIKGNRGRINRSEF